MPHLAPPLLGRRPELVIRPLGEGGPYVVKDPRSGAYYHLGEEEHFLLTQLDGRAMRRRCAPTSWGVGCHHPAARLWRPQAPAGTLPGFHDKGCHISPRMVDVTGEGRMAEVQPDSAATRALLEGIRRGDARALESLLERYRPELRAFVESHFDPRLRARVDPSDIVQETQMEVVRRMDDFLAHQPMPFRLWLRKKAMDRLLNLRRDHLARARRSVAREQALPDRSSLLVAGPLLARAPSPSQQLQARERAERISRAVACLAHADREILLLRHAEDLPFEEISCLLDIEPAAARKRFGRALIRLQKALREEGLLESLP
jgi:RNA polymerase sigma-70 factor (ECF subfamily)